MAHLQRLVISASQCPHRTVTLSPEQQHYLSRVLRLNGGDHFIALREQEWWLAQLHPSQVEAQLVEPMPIQTELAQPLTLLAALPKGTGFDEVVRSTTEMGVSTIIPLLTERTFLNPSANKVERWRRIATEAAEQSCRQRVPEIVAPMTFEAVLALAQTERFAQQQRLICVTEAAEMTLWQVLSNVSSQTSSWGILVMVGPEGGWTSAEQTAALTQGFIPVSLGRRVLRAVTASRAAVAILSASMDTPSG